MRKLFGFGVLCICLATGLYAQQHTVSGKDKPAIHHDGVRVQGMLDRYLSRSMMLALFTDHVGRPGYPDQMQMIRKLKPAYLSRIAGSWGLPETEMLPGGKLYVKTMKIIQDVYQMYREDGVAQPMIEAGIFEAITSDVNNIPIPKWVIAEFADEVDAQDIKYSETRPLHFNADSMRNGKHPNWSEQTWVPDINRIHTRMWFYYLSSIFVDMGCNSLHMGWFDLITEHDSLYLKTNRLFKKIRDYAKRKNSFVIFNADVDRAIYVGDTQHLLLDFLSTPIRPEATLNSFQNTPCENQPMTELNIARYNPGIMKKQGGITHDGDTLKTLPVLFNLDWYGVSYKGKQPGQMGMGSGGWAPWAVNESAWFFSLSNECQAYWLRNTAVAIKNNLVDRGYVKVPGVQPITWWGYPVTEYLMIRNKQLIETIHEDLWKVNAAPFFTVNHIPHEDAYMLSISNPDFTSIYTWQVQHIESGNVHDDVYGLSHTLKNLSAGSYRITLRQDNAMFVGKQQLQLVTKEIKVEK
jgi:hypothetical protein